MSKDSRMAEYDVNSPLLGSSPLDFFHDDLIRSLFLLSITSRSRDITALELDLDIIIVFINSALDRRGRSDICWPCFLLCWRNGRYGGG
jgi:hypothetical protein